MFHLRLGRHAKSRYELRLPALIGLCLTTILSHETLFRWRFLNKQNDDIIGELWCVIEILVIGIRDIQQLVPRFQLSVAIADIYVCCGKRAVNLLRGRWKVIFLISHISFHLSPLPIAKSKCLFYASLTANSMPNYLLPHSPGHRLFTYKRWILTEWADMLILLFYFQLIS